MDALSYGLIIGLTLGLIIGWIGYLYLSLQKEKLIEEKERMIINLMNIMNKVNIRRK
jgi:hypothetical protein